MVADRLNMALRLGAAVFALAVMSSCGASRLETRPPASDRDTPSDTETLLPSGELALVRVEFDDLPGWSRAGLEAALRAFVLSCRAFAQKDPSEIVSAHAGRVRDWLAPCRDAATTDPASARAFFASHFVPFEIAPDATNSKITGYFEPQMQARHSPEGLYTAAIPGRPDDLVNLNLRVFDKTLPKKTFKARIHNGRLTPYPPRADIINAPDRALGYATPEDVYFLQIQGSGRAVFPDGQVVRILYNDNNGHSFRSIATHLIDTGKISRQQASMAGIKKWLRSVSSSQAQKAMNINPRYIWFRAQPLTNPLLGPDGAQGQPLTPMASLAVDPVHHPYGLPLYIDTRVPRRAGDWRGRVWQSLVIAQDTGNAIRGVRRGDLFFGSGDAAGARAGNMNHPARMWALLPRRVATRLLVAERDR